MIMLLPEDFRERDIYIDFPYEDSMFRWEKETGKVFRRRYGKRETEIDHTSDPFREAVSAGREIDRDTYFADYPTSGTLNVISRFLRLFKP